MSDRTDLTVVDTGVEDGGDIANDNNIVKLLRAFCGFGVQPVEDAGQQLITQRGLATAVGNQLDVLGRIVGLARNGLDDDTYRIYLGAQIVTLRSQGDVETLIKVAVLIVNDPTNTTIVVTRDGTATIRIRVSSTVGIADDLAAILLSFERQATAAGVRLIIQWGEVPDAQLFRFDSGPGFDQGRLAGALDA